MKGKAKQNMEEVIKGKKSQRAKKGGIKEWGRRNKDGWKDKTKFKKRGMQGKVPDKEKDNIN